MFAMSKKQKRAPKAKTKKPARDYGAVFRRVVLFAILLAVLVGSLYVLKFLESDRGRFWVVHDFRQESPAILSPMVKSAIEGAASGLALPGGMRLHEHLAQARSLRSWEIQVKPEYSLLQANMVFTAQLAGIGCEVIDGVEGSTRKGDYLRLVAGVDGFPTDIIYLREALQMLEEEPKALLAIVIDDFGFQRKKLVRQFLDLRFPLTVAVLPDYKYSRMYAEEALSKGHEVILHLPMEPIDYPRKDPGRGAILVDMSPDQIRAAIEKALRRLPAVRGVSNHMGSLATQDPNVMTVVLDELNKNELYFLDSYTTPRSVAKEIAADCGTPYLRNRMFIDDGTVSAEEVGKFLNRAKELALRNKKVIVTGHVYEHTLEALEQFLPQLEEEGVKLVTVSELLPKPVFVQHE